MTLRMHLLELCYSERAGLGGINIVTRVAQEQVSRTTIGKWQHVGAWALDRRASTSSSRRQDNMDRASQVLVLGVLPHHLKCSQGHRQVIGVLRAGHRASLGSL